MSSSNSLKYSKLTAGLISVIGSLSIGQLFDKNSDLVQKITENTIMFSKIAPKVLLADLLPVTRPFLLRESWQRLQRFSKDLTSYILGKIAEHDQMESNDDTIRDLQDAFDKVCFLQFLKDLLKNKWMAMLERNCKLLNSIS